MTWIRKHIRMENQHLCKNARRLRHLLQYFIVECNLRTQATIDDTVVWIKYEKISPSLIQLTEMFCQMPFENQKEKIRFISSREKYGIDFTDS